MSCFRTLKTFTLAILIIAGFTMQSKHAKAGGLETLTVAGGCFWCVEADFEKVQGVKDVVSGFTGGSVENPTYKQVVRGGTGHYEAVQIMFDPSVVNRDSILTLFFRSIDPTDSGGQFCDRGETFRTAIFPNGPEQQAAAQRAKAQAEAQLGQSIVTPILSSGPFYPAEAYHQDFYKSSDVILTRFGPKRKSAAYTAYRKSCKRDERVRQLWGNDAPFIGG